MSEITQQQIHPTAPAITPDSNELTPSYQDAITSPPYSLSDELFKSSYPTDISRDNELLPSTVNKISGNGWAVNRLPFDSNKSEKVPVYNQPQPVQTQVSRDEGCCGSQECDCCTLERCTGEGCCLLCRCFCLICSALSVCHI